MRVLIIGGTGLISTGITRARITRGDDVTLYNFVRMRSEHRCHLSHTPTIRQVDWLDTRGRIHNRDEPEIYSEIIER